MEFLCCSDAPASQRIFLSLPADFADGAVLNRVGFSKDPFSAVFDIEIASIYQRIEVPMLSG